MKFKLLLAAVMVAALAAGFWFAQQQRAGAVAEPDTDAVILVQPRDPGTFRLVDHRGDAFTPAEVTGQWTLWFFGFTHCPDVCPMTLTTLNLVDRALADAGAVRPQVVMVSVDPARDSPEKLAEYVPYFNEAFVGVTGDAGQIRELTERVGILVRYIAQDDDAYTVDHGAALLLTGPDGNVRALFQAPHDPHRLARDLAELIPWFERKDEAGT
ncbi:MAG: SCO family protein [Xanthomonadaceae bacterium]|nr:SCO family protein [Xanthomonadaceae bacterium]